MSAKTWAWVAPVAFTIAGGVVDHVVRKEQKAPPGPPRMDDELRAAVERQLENQRDPAALRQFAEQLDAESFHDDAARFRARAAAIEEGLRSAAPSSSGSGADLRKGPPEPREVDVRNAAHVRALQRELGIPVNGMYDWSTARKAYERDKDAPSPLVWPLPPADPKAPEAWLQGALR